MIQKYGLYERILNQKPRKTVEIYDSSVRDQVFMKVRNLIAGSLEFVHYHTMRTIMSLEQLKTLDEV